jgi:O-acetylhomoserine/O-acetylserine sulfhydrylase-like pyridoxal-dependent enzyme
MKPEQKLSDGVRKYVDAANKAKADRERYVKEVVKKWKFDTIAVHGLYSVEEALEKNQGAVIEPIYMSSSQAWHDSDEMEAALAYLIPGWAYSRIANPSTTYLEQTLALLETYGTDFDATCCATSSGMSAIFSATEPLLAIEPQQTGPWNFVSARQVYGGTYMLFNVRHPQMGAQVRWVNDAANMDEWNSKIDQNTSFLFGELPSNPGQTFFDISAVAKVAHAHNIPLIIDSTIATPALLRPFEHGADIVIHSVTKTMTSSGFGIAGAVIARKGLYYKSIPWDGQEDYAAYLKMLPNRDFGPNLSPFHAILTLNDLRTLRSKVDYLSRSTMKVAEFLSIHPKVERVEYLGLPHHPLHELASRYMWLVDSEYDDIYNMRVNRYGHLLSFLVKDGHLAARRILDGLKRIWRSTDLGRIKSIANIPTISTHQQQGEESRLEAGIPPNLIRLCVGAEHPDDIIDDLEQALAKA